MKPPRPTPTDSVAAREARRSEALRANLRRRKLADAPLRAPASDGEGGEHPPEDAGT